VGSIEIESVSKVYGNQVLAVDDLSLSIHDGEFMVLVGPSGCGKTTLLRMIAGLETITEGELSIAGQNVTEVAPSKRDIAMVFQNYALYPHMTVRDNLGFSLKMARRPKAEIKTRVEEVASLLALDGLLERKPKALSGGQRQRVAMGRAMVRQPSAYLMDEPLSNLDAKLRVTLRAELAKLHTRLGVTTVYVTHDQVEAMTLGQRVAIMSRGRLLQCGTPEELFETPASTFVAAFMGSPGMNLLQSTISQGEVTLGTTKIRIPEKFGRMKDGPVTLGVRPGDFEIVGPHVDPEHPRLTAVASGVENLGSERRVYVEIPGRPAVVESTGESSDDEDEPGANLLTDQDHTVIVASVRPSAQVAVGDQVELAIDSSSIHLFGADSGEALR
jgi:multiple sugar transport system ATP-binding protein